MSVLHRLFPTPAYIATPVAGVDFSDATIRFVRLAQYPEGLLPAQFGQEAIPEGCIQGGRVVDENRFVSFLSEMKQKQKLEYVRIAMPESQVYSFTLILDAAAGDDIRGAIELTIEDNIPLKAIEAIFDYHILHVSEDHITVQVAAVSEPIVQTLLSCFSQAGMVVVGCELDGQAIARALVPHKDPKSYMIVDFGAKRTGITIVTGGVAVYTSTLEFGGRNLLQMLANELKVSVEEADKIKREHGLTASGPHKNIFSILVGGLSTVRDEINRRYVYWHEKKQQQLPFAGSVETVYLCGGHSNLRGLPDYLSALLKLKVVLANPWTNCVSFEKAIPELSHDESMSYVTAIGLSLGEFLYD